MNKPLALLAVSVCSIVVVWFAVLAQEPDHAAPLAPDPEDRGATIAADPTTHPTSLPRVGGTEAATSERKAAAPAAAESTVTVHGRCVDTRSVPMAGCVVRLQGWPANTERMQKHVAVHGPVQWKNPPEQTTSPDGLFSFTFIPSAPYHYALHARRPGMVVMQGRWSELPPGTKDLGDVVMKPGVPVSGRITDTDSTPQENVRIGLQPQEYGRDSGRMRPLDSFNARSGADGMFRFEDAVPAATWRPDLGSSQLIEPKAIEVKEGAASLFVDVVIRKKSDIPAITGIVRDDAGAPISGAQVDFDPRFGARSGIATDREGRFRIECGPEEAEAPVQIRVALDGFESLRTPEKHAWGTRDLELVLRRGLAVEVFVTDRETGKPIEEFGVRCFEDPETATSHRTSDYRLRSKGRHPGGSLRLSGLRRGRQILLVEPSGSEYSLSGFQHFEITDSGAPVQQVRLSHPSERVLQVVRKDGSPVQATAVELLSPMLVRPVGIKSIATRLERLEGGTSDPDRALLLQSGTTDAQGELRLSGPPGQDLAVRVLGPGHQPVIVQPVSLDAGLAALRIEVPSGARISGKIRPLAALRQFHPPADVIEESSRDEPGRKRLARMFPGVRVRRFGNFRETYPTGHEQVAIGTDGSFLLSGIPPGKWDLVLSVPTFMKSGHSLNWETLQTLELGEGDEKQLELDVGHMLRGRLEGRILRDGAPMAGASFFLRATRLDGSGGRRQVIGVPNSLMTADDQGRFAVDTPSGNYSVAVQIEQDPRGFPKTLPSVERAELVAGCTTRQDFHVRSAKLRVRVLASDAKTALGSIQLRVSTEDRSEWMATVETDQEGWVVLDHVPLARLLVRTWPRHLATAVAREQHWKKDPVADLDRLLLDVGTVEVTTENEETKCELTVPGASGY